MWTSLESLIKYVANGFWFFSCVYIARSKLTMLWKHKFIWIFRPTLLGIVSNKMRNTQQCILNVIHSNWWAMKGMEFIHYVQDISIPRSFESCRGYKSNYIRYPLPDHLNNIDFCKWIDSDNGTILDTILKHCSTFLVCTIDVQRNKINWN